MNSLEGVKRTVKHKKTTAEGRVEGSEK